MGRARPLHATRARGAASARFGLVEAAAADLGVSLMDWQARVARVACEQDREGLPRYRSVLATLPRQQGKTWLVRVMMLEAARQRPNAMIGYTAQSRLAASDRLKEAAREFQRLGVGVERATFGAGNERIVFENGSVIFPIAPNEKAGHGFSLDYLVADELHAIEPFAMGAMVPAMAARPHAQLLAISTMGTASSVVMNDMVARGREGADDLAFFEWAVPEGADPYDEDEWWRCMPALGVSVDVEAVRAAASAMSRAEFIRAFANRLTTSAEPVVPQEWWDDAQGVREISGAVGLAVDVNLGPAGCSIGAAWVSDGDLCVELVGYESGESVAWLPGRLGEVLANRRPVAVGIDPGGPAAVVFSDVRSVCEAAGVPVLQMKPSRTAAGTARWYEALRTGSGVVSPSEPLDLAIGGAVRKNLGDQWLFDRRRSVNDVSPLNAVAMAAFVVAEEGAKPPVMIY